MEQQPFIEAIVDGDAFENRKGWEKELDKTWEVGAFLHVGVRVRFLNFS